MPQPMYSNLNQFLLADDLEEIDLSFWEKLDGIELKAELDREYPEDQE